MRPVRMSGVVQHSPNSRLLSCLMLLTSLRKALNIKNNAGLVPKCIHQSGFSIRIPVLSPTFHSENPTTQHLLSSSGSYSTQRKRILKTRTPKPLTTGTTHHVLRR
jgi:hypothetical protein